MNQVDAQCTDSFLLQLRSIVQHPDMDKNGVGYLPAGERSYFLLVLNLVWSGFRSEDRVKSCEA